MIKRYREVKGSGRDQARAPRAARLPRFMHMAPRAPERLDDLRVFIVGCGAVGRLMALHVARLQVGELWLADPKRYKAVSLLTQAILPKEIGLCKAQTTARQCKLVSPRTRVHYLNDRVQASGWAELAKADLVLLATDNLTVEADVGRVCFGLGIPLVTAAVHGASLVAQVKVLGHGGGESEPCLYCLLSAAEVKAHEGERSFGCEEIHVEAAQGHTVSVSSLCSLAADLALNQVLRLVLRLGESVANTMVELCGYNLRSTIYPLKRRSSCPEEHGTWRRARSGRALEQLSVREAVRLAGWRADRDGLSLVAGNLEWVERALCGCAIPQPINRFVDRSQKLLGRCSECKQPLHRGSFYSHATVPVELLRPFARVPLRTLGASEVPWLMVRREGHGVWISGSEEKR